MTDAAWSRHPRRSNAFDAAILRCDRRAWHPLTLSPELCSQPHDPSAALIHEAAVPGLRAPDVRARLGSREARARFANATTRQYVSDILHGERAALRYAARLCLEADDLGLQESAANQAREEARHVSAFSFYAQRCWGEPAAPTPVFATLLDEIEGGDALQRIVGMQVVVEGLAMGVFGALQRSMIDPLGREIIRRVRADEAAHLHAGAASLRQALGGASAQAVRTTRLWTARWFAALVRDLFAPTGQSALYAEFGLDPHLAEAELRASAARGVAAPVFRGVFRILALAIARAGLAQRSARRIYAPFLPSG